MSNFESGTFMKAIPTVSSLLIGALFASSVLADEAVLVAEAVLVERNPSSQEEPADGEEGLITETTVGIAKNASYVSSGGWAVTSPEFIDKATFIFDFISAKSVAGATIILPIETVYAQNGSAPIKIEFFSDNGKIEFTDYTTGFPEAIAKTDAANKTEIRFDVTGAVNAALNTGRYVGFRVLSALEPSAVTLTLPAFTGVKFRTKAARLEFAPGAPPATNPAISAFNGFTLEVPNIAVPGVGQVSAQFNLVDPNGQIFLLSKATVTGTGVNIPVVSGLQLFDCAAFSPPITKAIVATGSSTYSINSGVLDIPDTTFSGNQFSVRMEFIEGSNPPKFELLNFRAISTDAGEAVETDLTGGLVVEPTQDFIPACHGWILIGDSLRKRVVERNVISGETGKIYQMNTVPDQFTFDEPNGLVYMTVHPESTRLYQLNLSTGIIKSSFVSQVVNGNLGAFHTYSWALRDIAMGESGNVFALMIDRVEENPGNSIPFATSGKWMGLMDGNANFLTQSLPLEEPVRIEYDPVKDHVFLATNSNLATFDFSTATNGITFIEGTDVEVGSSCTDFSISPDGLRLAYSCPDGNDKFKKENSIWDMNPVNYFDNDGAWTLENSPISASFNLDGTILVATDNQKLYFFDVVTHLLLEDYKLGLLAEESVKRIRFSKDGKLIIISLTNDVHVPNSKFLYMNTPPLTGTPLPP